MHIKLLNVQKQHQCIPMFIWFYGNCGHMVCMRVYVWLSLYVCMYLLHNLYFQSFGFDAVVHIIPHRNNARTYKQNDIETQT